eukprot:15069024-Heterocapsa_arctica.AAC.1
MNINRSNLGPSCPVEDSTDQSQHGKGCNRSKTCEEEGSRAERFRYRRRHQQFFQPHQRGKRIFQNYPDDTMEDERKPWAKHELVPA